MTGMSSRPLTMPSSRRQTGRQAKAHIMGPVMLACISGKLMATWFFRIGTLLHILLASVTAVASSVANSQTD